ncbi:MAG: hypothetical protein IJY82_04930 [Oscillospiraceae bacterium]|nr:hypothetical protein [Oscillospiraceae bacterium]
MAIWQVACSLIPCKKKNFLLSSLRSLCELAEALPEEKSWSSSIRQYGDLDSTCVEIFTKDGLKIDTISFRLDCQNISLEQIKVICNFAKANNLKILYKRRKYEADIGALKEIIIKSEAHRFLSDPEDFLRNLKK